MHCCIARAGGVAMDGDMEIADSSGAFRHVPSGITISNGSKRPAPTGISGKKYCDKVMLAKRALTMCGKALVA
jgi:hypothetical protein